MRKLTGVAYLERRMQILIESDSKLQSAFKEAHDIEKSNIKSAYNSGYRNAEIEFRMHNPENDISLYFDADRYFNEYHTTQENGK